MEKFSKYLPTIAVAVVWAIGNDYSKFTLLDGILLSLIGVSLVLLLRNEVQEKKTQQLREDTQQKEE